jgi:DNA-binding response OmpR family regulator
MSAEGKTILIIDDEPSLTDAISSALEYESFSVLIANDGETGLQTAFDKRPDLILLDLRMPDMDGIEVLKRVRANEWGKHARVVMMTAAGDTERMADAVEYGVDSYILKSDLQLQELVERVKEKLS